MHICPQTHTHTPPHSNKKSTLFLGWETREKPTSQSKPTLNFWPSLNPKQSRQTSMTYPTLIFFQQKGGWHDQIHVFKWSGQASNTICDIFLSVPGWLLGHLRACIIVTWHLGLCPVLIPLSPNCNDQGESINVPPHLKKLYIFSPNQVSLVSDSLWWTIFPLINIHNQELRFTTGPSLEELGASQPVGRWEEVSFTFHCDTEKRCKSQNWSPALLTAQPGTRV